MICLPKTSKSQQAEFIAVTHLAGTISEGWIKVKQMRVSDIRSGKSKTSIVCGSCTGFRNHNKKN
jgi:hypothetical protein